MTRTYVARLQPESGGIETGLGILLVVVIVERGSGITVIVDVRRTVFNVGSDEVLAVDNEFTSRDGRPFVTSEPSEDMLDVRLVNNGVRMTEGWSDPREPTSGVLVKYGTPQPLASFSSLFGLIWPGRAIQVFSNTGLAEAPTHN